MMTRYREKKFTLHTLFSIQCALKLLWLPICIMISILPFFENNVLLNNNTEVLNKADETSFSPMRETMMRRHAEDDASSCRR